MGMAEYIEREAVNALIEAECSPKVAAFLNHAIDNIPAADVRPVEWIPVKERLPEEQGWCVVCVLYRGIQWGDITTKGFTSVCPAYYFEGTFHKVSSEAEITHWMPLPEPPKEE